jgi:hypothetical protein
MARLTKDRIIEYLKHFAAPAAVTGITAATNSNSQHSSLLVRRY